ncbi:hypothetical protein TRICI_000969 [Trichomonascus ciferrii]|uniref:Ketoreductase (KR) domain-containing protein n=1 Tax=Trichomonascus ciferrii TaxID=44093 RepID=A0A642V9N1_9ASCO|nr:hypothetical protein TRICI_000969 [Trichomonascus ciferrii]
MPGVKFQTEDIPDLTDQVILVTGGNAGLGLESIKQLRRHNPKRIYLAARSQEKANAAIEQLNKEEPKFSSVPISFLSLDLTSFDSIKGAAETFFSSESRLDILINNAGIMMTPEGLTKDGYEIQFGTNVLGPALFTQLLLPALETTAKLNSQTRVVTLSSDLESRAPGDVYKLDELKTTMANRSSMARYGISKLGGIHFSNAMAEEHPNLKFISVHPGVVQTNLHQNAKGFFLKPFLNIMMNFFAVPVEKGALSQLWAAVSPDAKSGEYYAPIGLRGKGSKASKDTKLQQSIYQWIQQELSPHLT